MDVEGDQQIESWFRTYGSDVHNYLVYYLGIYEVEDLVQDVFFKAMRGLSNFEGRASPKTWLFSIARNVAHDFEYKQRMRKLLTLHFSKDRKELEKTPEEVLTLREEQEELLLLIRSLRPNYRDVLLLRLVQELSTTEVAEILDWSENKVSVTYHRALKSLRQLMIEQQGGVEIAGK